MLGRCQGRLAARGAQRRGDPRARRRGASWDQRLLEPEAARRRAARHVPGGDVHARDARARRGRRLGRTRRVRVRGLPRRRADAVDRERRGGAGVPSHAVRGLARGRGHRRGARELASGRRTGARGHHRRRVRKRKRRRRRRVERRARLASRRRGGPKLHGRRRRERKIADRRRRVCGSGRRGGVPGLLAAGGRQARGGVRGGPLERRGEDLRRARLGPSLARGAKQLFLGHNRTRYVRARCVRERSRRDSARGASVPAGELAVPAGRHGRRRLVCVSGTNVTRRRRRVGPSRGAQDGFARRAPGDAARVPEPRRAARLRGLGPPDRDLRQQR